MSENLTVKPDVSDERYRSYLLRLWREGSEGERRALLQDVLGSKPHYFPTLESLFAYLEASPEQPVEEHANDTVDS